MDVEVEPPPERLPCAFCRQEVALAAARTCRRCATPYHPDCWEANDGRCAVYACDPPPPKPAGPNETVQVSWIQEPLQAGPPRNNRWMWIVLLVGISSVLRLLNGVSSRPSESPPPSPALRFEGITERPQLHEITGLLREARDLVQSAQPEYAWLAEVPDLPRGRAERLGLLDEVRKAQARVRKARAIYLRCQTVAPLDPRLEGLETANRTLAGLESLDELLSR